MVASTRRLHSFWSSPLFLLALVRLFGGGREGRKRERETGERV